MGASPTAPPSGVAQPAAPGGRAGRNVPVAVAVGLSLGAVIIVPLYLDTPVFIAVLVATVLVGITEVARSLRTIGRDVPLPPVIGGAVLMIALAYARGSSALLVGLLLTLLAVLGWGYLAALVRPAAADGGPDRLRSGAAAAFTALYVPFLASFCALLAAPADGPGRVTTFIATVVCSDVGGFAAGVAFGRHPMAPTVSPKKSWEGFAGSLLACLVAGAIFLPVLLHAAWWTGPLYGLAVASAATIGDLGESLVKRDIGVKDMGRLLPGHGGIMDRLDSLLVAAPVAWLLLSTLAPVR